MDESPYGDMWPEETEAAAPPPGRPGGPIRQLTLAVTFLTGIPLPVRGEVTPAELWRSMGWYPLVGLALGAAAWGLYSGLLVLLPGLVAAVLVVLALEVLTRGLHMDGLMDTADGLFSGAPRERALEIMKDSQVGAMGVVAAILIVLLKVAALAALTRADAAAPLLVGWAAARTLPSIDVYAWPYARRAGTGEAFTREHSPGPVVLAAALLGGALVASAIVSIAVGGAAGWWAGAAIAALAIGVTLLVQAAAAKRLGGLTGDVYGMGIQLAEAAALVVGCALAH
jgi:adenosylcobinamide-GDP ribazoletransferase